MRNNKSKRKTTIGASHPSLITNWIYCHKDSISVRDLQQALKDRFRTELWEDARVFEINLSESDMDFEYAEADRDVEFIVENDIFSVYFVSFGAEAAREATEAMEDIVKELGGFFVADNDDLTPRIG
mgnify:CR=1 FL=1